MAVERDEIVCPRCRQALKATARFCPRCGEPTRSDQAPEPAFESPLQSESDDTDYGAHPGVRRPRRRASGQGWLVMVAGAFVSLVVFGGLIWFNGHGHHGGSGESGAGNGTIAPPAAIKILPPPSGVRTLVLDPQGQDVWITDTYDNGSNFGVDNNELIVGGWGDRYWSLLRFDLSGSDLPSVSRATLRLYNLNNNSGSPAEMDVAEILTPWDETIGWYDQPPLRWNRGLPTVPRPALGWLEVDVTALVNRWLTNPASNHGFALVPTETNNNFNKFSSSDAIDVAQRPELVLTP